MVADWSRGAAHAGRLVAFLVALRGVGWLRILSGCRLILMVSPDVGRVSRSSCRDRLPLLFVISLSGCCCPHVGRLVAFLVALRCVGWLSVGRGAAAHVGRFSVVLWHPVGVSVASDGVPRCREGVAVILSGSVAVALRCQLVGGAAHALQLPGVGRAELCTMTARRQPPSASFYKKSTPWAYTKAQSVAAIFLDNISHKSKKPR